MVSTSVGYCGGRTSEPTYDAVCYGTTGHAEVVRIEFDPCVVTFSRLLDMFFKMHNPGATWRRDPDSQYRSAVFATTEEQLRLALEKKAELEASRRYPGGVSTEIRMAPEFWRAEEYHQGYFEKHRLGACRV